MIDKIKSDAKKALEELLAVTSYEEGDIVIVGCSTSEVMGSNPGKASSLEVGRALVDTLLPIVKSKGLYLGAQCCEHLNRSVIIEREAQRLHRLERVNAKPKLHAGGAFATSLWDALEEPTAVEGVQAVCGMDVGGVLIGMQLRPVAVPVRASVDTVGKARLILARTRPRFVGGERAEYVDELR